jgi:olfactory receptor
MWKFSTCELNQVVHHTCSDTFLNVVVIYLAAVLLTCCPLVDILYSYSKIIRTTRTILSAQGKDKEFSIYTSHLSVVSLFYSRSLGMYLSSTVTENSYSTAKTLLMYNVVTPMLNPFIFRLRNKDIKRALKRLFQVKFQ